MSNQSSSFWQNRETEQPGSLESHSRPWTSDDEPWLEPEPALETVLRELIPSSATETLALEESLDRILCEDLFSKVDSPAFSLSQMDGYAVSAQWLEKMGEPPFSLPCVGTIYPGQAEFPAMSSEQAVRIMTGAPVPPQTDAVIKVEDTDGGSGAVTFFVKPQRGMNITPKGGVMPCGTALALSGDRITWGVIGLLASFGIESVKVSPRPAVAILTTGDELAGSSRGKHEIFNSTLPALAGMMRAEGVATVASGAVSDDPQMIRQACLQALDRGADFLVLTGGVSRGLKDYVRGVLEDLGMVAKLHSVRQKPGKPMAVYTMDLQGRRVMAFALPGNPVSALLCAIRYLLPSFRVWQGVDRDRALTRLQGVLARDIPADRTRHTMVPCRLYSSQDGALVIDPLKLSTSADLKTLSMASGLIWVRAGENARAGDEVFMELFAEGI